jgi:hypothetical protein
VKLPRGEDAIIPPGKVESYCLDMTHRIGGPKARVFSAALGLTRRDADLLTVALTAAARTQDAVVVRRDRYGDHYRIDFRLRHAGRERTVRSGWTIREAGGPPYLTTAFVLSSAHD